MTNLRDNIGILRWLGEIVRVLPRYTGPILAFSVVANLLLLVSPFYMLQVYDRILTSGSLDTLIWLTVISIFLLGIYATAEIGRRRLCSLAADAIDERMSQNAFSDFAGDPAAEARLPSTLRRMARIQGYFANQAILPFFDLPFAPFFLAVMFVIHPLIGLIGLIGAGIMLALAVVAEATTRGTHDKASALDSDAFELALGLGGQRSAIVSMGLTGPALAAWQQKKALAKSVALSGGKREISFTSITRSCRQILQILVLGVGGALAVSQQVSPGTIVAGSIILSRALAPIDQIVAGWRAISSVRLAWSELGEGAFEAAPAEDYTPLPKPDAVLALDKLAVAAPGATAAVLRPFMLTLSGGSLTTLLGPIGSGKTTLLQTIAGAWTPFSGEVRLGGCNLHTWNSDDRGINVGYVPQQVQLLPGTVFQNISRLSQCDPEEVIDAARRASAHEMILSMPDGYDTLLGVADSSPISAGQRQLVGLARALFGRPTLLVLDEPTANLDWVAGRKVIASLKAEAERGAIVIIATHDIRLVRVSDSLLVIQGGGVITSDPQKYLSVSQTPQSTVSANEYMS